MYLWSLCVCGLSGQLSALLPELVVKVVHGSMDRNDVEETLVQFAMGKGTTPPPHTTYTRPPPCL